MAAAFNNGGDSNEYIGSLKKALKGSKMKKGSVKRCF
jgi:hypothetical protein